MCRWIAYQGQPVFLEEFITKPEHSLRRQGHDTRENHYSNGELRPLNEDGFGFGWYGEKEEPGLYRSVTPVWTNSNLESMCQQIKSPLFMAHIRAASAGSIQTSNCHPFKRDNWLFQHNGRFGDFGEIKQDIHAKISPRLYADFHGSTDSEAFFYLALTYGLQENPVGALREAFQTVADIYEKHEIEPHVNFSCALTDGKILYTFLHAVGDEAKTQYYSTDKDCDLDLGEGQIILPEDSVVVVSEPLNGNREQWHAIPPNTFTTIQNGHVEIEEFIHS